MGRCTSGMEGGEIRMWPTKHHGGELPPAFQGREELLTILDNAEEMIEVADGSTYQWHGPFIYKRDPQRPSVQATGQLSLHSYNERIIQGSCISIKAALWAGALPIDNHRGYRFGCDSIAITAATAHLHQPRLKQTRGG